MMSNMTDDHWGERNVARRDRQRWVLKGTMIAVALAFLAAAFFLLPAQGADGAHAILMLVFMVAIAGLWLVGWRLIDEVRRRVAINAFAVMGITCLMLMPLAGVAGPLIGLTSPMMAVYIIAVLTMPVSVAVQRIRG